MPIDLTAVRHAHKRFLRANTMMLERVSGQASRVAIRTQTERPGFQHRTGRARRSARAKIIRLRSGRRVRITNLAPHAIFLEGGTRPHVIRARRGRALSFFWARIGRRVVVRSVNHPGTKPYRFIQRSADAAEAIAGIELKSGMRRIASQF